MLVMLGEVGGLDEYAVVAALKDKRITKPLVAWCIGTCAKVRPPSCWRRVAASVDVETTVTRARPCARCSPSRCSSGMPARSPTPRHRPQTPRTSARPLSCLLRVCRAAQWLPQLQTALPCEMSCRCREMSCRCRSVGRGVDRCRVCCACCRAAQRLPQLQTALPCEMSCRCRSVGRGVDRCR
jgi:hypothetical protein